MGESHCQEQCKMPPKRHVKTGSLKDQNKALRSTKAGSRCLPGQETGKHQIHTQGAVQGARALPTVTGPAPQHADFGLPGRWAEDLPTPAAAHSCRQCPLATPAAALNRARAGAARQWAEQAPSCVRLARKSHKPYLPEIMQPAAWSERDVWQIMLAGAELPSAWF